MADTSNTDLDDIGLDGIWAALPVRWHPFVTLARLDRPIGWWLLLLPGWQAILIAGTLQQKEFLHLLFLMLLFLIGAVVMRGAGCVINDWWDRDLDKSVERTRNRPLASGQVSMRGALIFLAGLASIGAGVLFLLPREAIITGLFSLPLIVVYPLAKRVMGLPQLALSLTFSWGALLGWAAVGTWPGWEAGLLYIASAFWVFGYDTIYAVQDMADDTKLGIGSSALTLGGMVRPVVAFVYGAMILLLLTLGALIDAGWGWMAGVAIAAIHCRWQISRLDPENPGLAGRIFRSNRDTGLILTGAALAFYIERTLL
ncbi:4-hydroxybenzoate octaprenyltransferase [Alphaproteobacteria bacterium LSUCC0684]